MEGCMNKKRKTGIIVLIVVIALALLCALASTELLITGKKNFNGEKPNKHFNSNKKDGYIATLYIEGTIQDKNETYNQEWLLKTIKDLKKDSLNKGIAIFINSPGGTVYEADEIYLALQDYKTKAKPIYVYQGQIAASGGYYISCAGNKIYANRNTLTGSIGVISASTFDMTDFLSNLGIKSSTIHSGKNKNMGNFNEPLSEEQKQILQSIADECYKQFTDIVAMRRNIPINDVKKLADGRIYTAKQALHNNLIDSIDSWENMLNDMKNDEFEGKDLKLVEFRYTREKSFKDYIFGKTFKEQNDVCASIEKLFSNQKIQYPAYLYNY